MDTQTESQLPNPVAMAEVPIAVTGAGSIITGPQSLPEGNSLDLQKEVLQWLKSKKTRKFMGKQDMLAVISAGMAVRMASIDEKILRERSGIYLAVGYIPFEQEDIEPLAKNSMENGNFSMNQFSTKGFEQVNPLLTFRCLPNMPIFHVSLNLGIQGRYFITYPGIGQFYLALEQAVEALSQEEIDIAIVGAVADQNNFLVDHHFKRIGWNQKRADVGAFLCLERVDHAKNRNGDIKMELLSYKIDYRPHDPFQLPMRLNEEIRLADKSLLPLDEAGYLGAASLPSSLSWVIENKRSMEILHSVETMDGIIASSRWLAI